MTVRTDGGAEGAEGGAAATDTGAAGAPAAEDPFASAFDELTAPEPKAGEGDDGKPAEGDDGKPAEGDDGKPAEGADGRLAEGADGKPAEGADGKPAEGAEAPKGDEGAKPKPSADDILAGLEKLINKQPEGADDKGEKKPTGEEEQKPVYDEEETKFLEEYEKEWGDVRKGEALIRRAEYKELLGYVFSEVAKFVAPIKEVTDLLAERTHFADVESAVPDYSENLRADVEEWVKTQPTYLQAAYNQVITEGTVDEVKDLVERYRAATGKAATTGKPEGAPPQKKPGDNELSEPAKKAAAALAPVESKRSGVQQPQDPSDYDDAWKQFANADTV